MMKMIKPIVNISKILDAYDIVIVGNNGVLTDGDVYKADAINALVNIKKAGKKVFMVTNSSKRLETLVYELKSAGLPISVFDNIVSAGEILHYKLKSKIGKFAVIGEKYFHLGNSSDKSVFDGLQEYKAVSAIENAEFIYINDTAGLDDIIENYLPALEHAASLSIPMLCVGNDTSCFKSGAICLGAAAVAEQYAMLGGQIITLGKPEAFMLKYALESVANIDLNKVLNIGDSLTTDIKAGNILSIPSVLISKGVHVHYLGEGYIPDVAKTRELANTFDVYPDFVVSQLRW